MDVRISKMKDKKLILINSYKERIKRLSCLYCMDSFSCRESSFLEIISDRCRRDNNIRKSHRFATYNKIIGPGDDHRWMQ